MPCSNCREKGHTIKTCPKVKEEKIRIQRDRMNMFIQIFPSLMANPMMQGVLWWQISKRFHFTRFFNDIVVGGTVIDAIPFFNVDIQALPQGLVMGSAMQVAEDGKDYVIWLKDKELPVNISEGIGSETVPTEALTQLWDSLFGWVPDVNIQTSGSTAGTTYGGVNP